MKKTLGWQSLLVIGLFAVFSVLPSLFTPQTQAYRLDRVAYRINDYNKHSMLDPDFVPAELRVVKSDANESEKYRDLFEHYYYYPTAGNIRLCTTEPFHCDGKDVALLTQPTFAVSKEKKGTYYELDYRLYDVYYGNEIFPGREYLKLRDGADTFVFVSDTFADQLVQKYGLSQEENPYKTLMTNPDYYKITLSNDAGQSFTACINNIVSSTTKTGVRTKELYENFALFFESTDIQSITHLNFQIELMDNAFCINHTISDLTALGYTADKYNIDLRTFNNGSGQYEINASITQDLRDALLMGSDSVFVILYFLTIAAGAVAFFFLSAFLGRNTKLIYSFVLCACLFALFGIISNFIYTYFLFSVPPIVMLLVLLISARKEVKHAFERVFGKSTENRQKALFGVYSAKI